MLNLTQKICYSATPNELKQLFMDFLQKKYDYKPEFSVHFDTYIWLPIVVKMKQSNTASFLKFWNEFQSDILRLKNKHTGGEFELGDKILRMIFNKDTDSYLFRKECGEYVYGNNNVAHIFVKPDAVLSLEEEEAFQEKLREFQCDMSPFVFTKKDFNILQTEKSKIIDTETSVESGRISLTFSYENDQQFAVTIHFEKIEKLKVYVQTSGFCPTYEMRQEIRNISKEAEILCKEKLKHFFPKFEILDGTVLGLDLPITYYKGLGLVENVMFSLNKIHQLSYEETANLFVGRSARQIESFIRGIYEKYQNHQVDQSIAKYFSDNRK